MAKFNGRGLLNTFSCEKILVEPVPVTMLPTLLGLPESYGSILIAVRGSRKLNQNDLIYNDEEILLFLATLGG